MLFGPVSRGVRIVPPALVDEDVTLAMPMQLKGKA